MFSISTNKIVNNSLLWGFNFFYRAEKSQKSQKKQISNAINADSNCIILTFPHHHGRHQVHTSCEIAGYWQAPDSVHLFRPRFRSPAFLLHLSLLNFLDLNVIQKTFFFAKTNSGFILLLLHINESEIKSYFNLFHILS